MVAERPYPSTEAMERNKSFMLVHEAADCCPQRNAQIRHLAKIVASPCGCMDSCEATSQCRYFVHNAAKGVCKLCYGCENMAHSPAATSWQHVIRGALDGFHTGARLPVPPKTRCHPKRLRDAHGSWQQSEPVARYLGIRRSSTTPYATPLDKPVASCTSELTEELNFRGQCASRIRSMDRHLSLAHQSRRGLYFQFVKSTSNTASVGWGHSMSTAAALHYLCLRAARRCYIALFAHDLGAFWGYANGESWAGPPDWTEWPADTTPTYINGEEQWRNTSTLTTLVDSWRREQKPMLHVIFRGNVIPDEWVPFMPLCNRDGGIDRCFVRYVTEPRFRDQLGPSGSIKPPSAVYHIRTGLADVTDASILGASVCSEKYSDTKLVVSAGPEEWVDAACLRSRFAAGAFVISDSPRLARYLVSSRRLQSNPINTSAGTTRTWKFAGQVQRSALLYTAADYFIAGLAAEVHASLISSFVRPIIARSMCVQHVQHISDSDAAVCPHFHRIFVRDLFGYFDTGAGRSQYECLRTQLPFNHPCKHSMTPRACRERFVAQLL